MALDPGKLAGPPGGLVTAWSGYPATTLLAAQAWANAYDTYAKLAQACSGLTPTVVDLAGLTDGLKTALDSAGSYADQAQAVADAHEKYWTGGAFGATGLVTAIGGTSALKSGLESLWQAQSLAVALFPDSAAAHAALFDTFTKTVLVQDTAVPPPSGCGPAPIF